MRELFVERRTVRGEDGVSHCFDYYVVIGEMEVAEHFSCESYGVKVAQRGGTEAAEIPNVTTSVARIDELLEWLTRNFVTPSTLRDVVEDWL